MIHRTAKLIAVAALSVVGALLPASAAAAPAPAWNVSLTSQPTNFAPGAATGHQYRFRATNVGGAATSGTITVTDTLPAGITPTTTFTTSHNGAKSTCVVSAPTVTCTNPGPVYPGEWISIDINVSIGALPVGTTVFNQATIEGGGAAPVVGSTTTTISASFPVFDFLPGSPGPGLSPTLIEEDGSSSTQAGAHPARFNINFHFPTLPFASPKAVADGGEHDLKTNLPRGVVVDPLATPRCTEVQFVSGGPSPGCPLASQVGTATIPVLGVPQVASLFNMVPPPGFPAMFGFNGGGSGVYVHILGGVRTGDDYGLFADSKEIFGGFGVQFIQVQFWGDPSSPSHDAIRGICRNAPAGDLCPVEPQSRALITMPSSCRDSISVKASADSWGDIGNFQHRSAPFSDAEGNSVAVSGCNQLDFDPTIEAQPTTNLADSPTGLNFNLHQPQNLDYEGLSTANLRDTTVRLPEGLTVNPSSADGLDACSISEVGLTTEVGEAPLHFTPDPTECPDDSKLGFVEVKTPLIDHPLPGAVYLAEPYENPFGSLLAIYLTIHDEETEVVGKFAGKVTPDPSTGQLTATFEENPELPIDDIKVNFFGGPRASLRTPPTCAAYTTVADLTPWSAPEGPDAHPKDSFVIQTAPASDSCPTVPAGAVHKPSFTAGTVDPVAGAYSPFVFKVSREDVSQELSAIETTLPPGLSANIAGIPYCPEDAIAAAKLREKPNEGALEISNPSCPKASEVGTVDVAAGAGITPLHVQGHAYLAGPYKGAPLSLVVIVPAVAGPFDLGSVVVRTALQVDPRTAQVRAVVDPMPTILEGIPLDVRSDAFRADRPNFSLNPTSCEEMAVLGSATSVLGQTASLSNRFQVGGCASLPFKPNLSVDLKGKTRRGGHPALTAVATFTGGHANTKRAAVTLPRSAFLDQAHIRTVCTRVQFAADQCPKAAIYGFARAFTPLLDQPLEGPVYLRSSDNELPDLVADLKGQVDVELVGRVDSIKGGIRNTFEAAPDAPVSKFVLKMQGGRKGLLINSANLCKLPKAKRRANVKLDAHNGKARDFRPVVGDDCGKKARRGGKGKQR